jgi:hypothetical protein
MEKKMKILDMQRQGECLFVKVEDFTDDAADYRPVKPEGGKVIVAHSESGHHHVIDRSKAADMLISQTNEFIGRLVVKEDCEVRHLRSHNTHNTLSLTKGNYVLRWRREYTPEGLRRVMD